MKATKIPPVCVPVVEVVAVPEPVHKKPKYTAVEIVQAVKEIIDRNAPKPKPSDWVNARSLPWNLRWFNQIMAVGVEHDDVIGMGRGAWTILAREAIATRMRYIGNMEYALISSALRGNAGKHSAVMSMVKRVKHQMFGEEVPSEVKISSLLRSMSDDAWYGVLAAIHEARVSR